MDKHGAHELTQLLERWSDGEEEALEKLAPLVHAELYRLAKRYMRRERPDHLLQTSALINEAYIRLISLSLAVMARNGATLLTTSFSMLIHAGHLMGRESPLRCWTWNKSSKPSPKRHNCERNSKP
ncbi:MAG TPA: ECF-type sigma factor [Pyrinomonadaceae bacterium]|jgi:hypothetical protein